MSPRTPSMRALVDEDLRERASTSLSSTTGRSAASLLRRVEPAPRAARALSRFGPITGVCVVTAAPAAAGATAVDATRLSDENAMRRDGARKTRRRAGEGSSRDHHRCHIGRTSFLETSPDASRGDRRGRTTRMVTRRSSVGREPRHSAARGRSPVPWRAGSRACRSAAAAPRRRGAARAAPCSPRSGSRQCACSSSSVGVLPGRGCSNAATRSPQRSSGTPTTSTSNTSGCDFSAPSTSSG